MNIFFLDKCPKKAAEYLVDKHAANGKMVVEAAQMLANCYSLDILANPDCPKAQSGNDRSHSYFNHPCSKWVRESKANFDWLIEHAISIGNERLIRTGKGHYSLGFIRWCQNNNPNLPDIGFTFPALAMPDECKTEDFVESYRNYYRDNKSHLHSWTNREKPSWL